MWKKIKPYVISIAIALLTGGLGAFFTRDGMANYSELIKPPLTPPSWVFGVVWSILFILMGISSAIVYKKGGKGDALTVYAVQLVMNFIWTILFFNFDAYLFSFVWLILLWIMIAYMIYLFSKYDKTAAYLQIPYLLWVAFAGYLNFMIYLMN